MTQRIEVYVGTAGHSAWFSDDRGQTWVHPNSHSGMYLEARVWALCHHPDAPEFLYAGTDMGVFRWSERTPLLFCRGKLGSAQPVEPALAG